MCVTHAAPHLEMTPSQVHYLAKTEQLELYPAKGSLRCGKRKRGNCLVPIGEIITSELRP